MVIEMQNLGIELSLVTYNTVVSGLYQMRMSREAMVFVGRMIVRGIQPDAFTFTAIIHAYCKEGEVRMAAWMLGAMNVVNCGRNILVYTILMAELCNQDKLEDAMVYLLKMLYEGIYPNTVTWNVLVCGVFRNLGCNGPSDFIQHIAMDISAGT
jgi:pentatricopeptide repeat protein